MHDMNICIYVVTMTITIYHNHIKTLYANSIHIVLLLCNTSCISVWVICRKKTHLDLDNHAVKIWCDSNGLKMTDERQKVRPWAVLYGLCTVWTLGSNWKLKQFFYCVVNTDPVLRTCQCVRWREIKGVSQDRVCSLVGWERRMKERG